MGMTRFKKGDRVLIDIPYSDKSVIGTVDIVRMGGYSINLDEPIPNAYTDVFGHSCTVSSVFKSGHGMQLLEREDD